MTTTEQDDLFKEHLEKILVAIGSSEVGEPVQVCFKTDWSKGGGYLGIVDAVDLKGRNGELNLIVKSANTNKQVRENIPLGECVDTELKFYESVVPIIKKFYAEKGANNVFSGIPKSFWVERFKDHEIIIMENLKVQGYDVWDNQIPMADENVAMIMREYAKLHALSFAFKSEHPRRFEALVVQLGDNVTNWMVKGKMLDACINNLRTMEAIVDPSMVKKLRQFTDGISEYILGHNFMSDEYAVISHGDCWCNNMMFKYNEGSTILESAKLIDFQLARSGPFSCDLTHFLGSCCDYNIWNNIEHYLKIYHTALTNELNELGSVKVVTLEEIQQQFRKYAKYGLILASFFLKVTFMKSHEAPSLDDTLSGMFIKKFSKLENDNLYTERMKFLIEYYYKNDLL